MSAPKARRPDLRGQGYMPKGGRAAAAEHNARERALAAAPPAPPAVPRDVEPVGRTRAAARRPVDRFAFGPWGVVVSVAVGVSLGITPAGASLADGVRWLVEVVVR